MPSSANGVFLPNSLTKNCLRTSHLPRVWYVPLPPHLVKARYNIIMQTASVVRVSGYISRRPGLDSRRFQIF
jgi:hypothetical protein